MKVDFSEVELDDINVQLQKFDIFFTKEDFALLKKFALNEVVAFLKQVSEVKFTKDGTLGIDTIYRVSKMFESSLKGKKIKNPFPLLSILDRFIVIVFLKLEETDEVPENEKSEILNMILGSIDKIFLVEGIHLHTLFPKAATVRKLLKEKFSSKSLPASAEKKKRVAVPAATVFRLQKEIDSKCPFCGNDDVAHFQTHHIDENPSNNDISNLLRLCPNCHSKINKREISQDQVVLVKKGLRGKQEIELYGITIDKENCSWTEYSGIPNAFKILRSNNKKSLFPILQFGLINHFSKTVVLKSIELRVKHLYSGMSGIPMAIPGPVAKMAVKKLIIRHDRNVQIIDDFEDIEIPSQKSIIYQIELLEDLMDGGVAPPDTRMILNFRFKFSNDIVLNIPKILLNTENENKGVKLLLLR